MKAFIALLVMAFCYANTALSQNVRRERPVNDSINNQGNNAFPGGQGRFPGFHGGEGGFMGFGGGGGFPEGGFPFGPGMMGGGTGNIDQFGVEFNDSYLKENALVLPAESDSTYKYFVESKKFDSKVSITFKDGKASVGKLPEGVILKQDGGELSFDIEGKKVEFTLKGNSDDCCIEIKSDKAVKIVLDGVNLKSKKGEVINVKGKKPLYIELAKGSENHLEDKYTEVAKREQFTGGFMPFMFGGQNNRDFETEELYGAKLRKPTNRSKEQGKSDIDGVLCTKGLLSFSGSGKLFIKGHNKNGIRSNSHIIFRPGNVIHVEVTQGKGVYSKGDLHILGGVLNIDGSDSGKDALRAEGSIYVSGGRTAIKASGTDKSEGIEAKYNIVIDGGTVEVASFDDAINSGGNLIINGGKVYAGAVMNDAIDSNGNLIINGGTVLAIGGDSPEHGLDAAEEESYKLVVNGGTIIATGGMAPTTAKESRQPCVICNPEQLDSGAVYSIETKKEALMALKLNRRYSRGGSLLFSLPKLKAGESYEIHKGNEGSWKPVFHVMMTDGKTGGTVVETVEKLQLPYSMVGRQQGMTFGPPMMGRE